MQNVRGRNDIAAPAGEKFKEKCTKRDQERGGLFILHAFYIIRGQKKVFVDQLFTKILRI